MPRTRTPVASEIPRWPATSAILNADGSGRLTMDGRGEDLVAGDLATTRALVIARVAASADELGRAVRLTSRDPDGEWELAIHPDGQVAELAARPAAERADASASSPPAPGAPPAVAGLPFASHADADARDAAPSPAPPTTAVTPTADPLDGDDLPTAPVLTRQTERTTRRPAPSTTPHQRRRTATRLGVALALLTGVATAVAIIITGGPDTVVQQPAAARTPTTPTPTTPGAITRVIDDARRKSQQRMADTARRENARATAAAKRANDQQSARAKRALRRRVAARNARRRAAARRAAARRAAPSTAVRPQPRRNAPPPPAPSRVSPPPPPPPPPPPARQCGEFDIC